MNNFELHNKIEKEIIKTKYGVVSISNIKFDSVEIQNILPDLVFEEDNLKFMFQKEQLSKREKILVLERFLPNAKVSDMVQFITNSISTNKTFYSFLAEGMLGLVFRDLFGYDLSVGIIDINETLNDTHSGSDVCMFDKKENVLIIGEAKFYEKFKSGMNAIISDFLHKKILNKLDSFKRKIENNDNSWEIVVKNLKLDLYDTITLSEFMQQKIIFAGFVLHSSEGEMNEYLKTEFYDDFDVSINDLKNNIKESIESDLIKPDYNLVLLHLPISDKKTLIKEIIERADKNLHQLRGE